MTPGRIWSPSHRIHSSRAPHLYTLHPPCTPSFTFYTFSSPIRHSPPRISTCHARLCMSISIIGHSKFPSAAAVTSASVNGRSIPAPVLYRIRPLTTVPNACASWASLQPAICSLHPSIILLASITGRHPSRYISQKHAICPFRALYFPLLYGGVGAFNHVRVMRRSKQALWRVASPIRPTPARRLLDFTLFARSYRRHCATVSLASLGSMVLFDAKTR